MDQLIVLFNGERRPGLYRLTAKINIDELSSLCQKHGFQFFYINGKNITSKADFFQTSAKIMNFPDYFGENWDAFNDCMNDLSLLSAKGYLLLYTQPDNFAQNDPQEWTIALDIFQEVVEYWAGTDTPLYVLLQTENLALNELKTI